MATSRRPPQGLLAFRRRSVSVVATVLAIGLLLLAVVLEATSPVIVWVDVALLVTAAAVHAAAAGTVGRRWEPGGLVCLAYLVVITLLVSVSFFHAATPQSDAFWFLLIPVGLSAVTMRAWLHAVVTTLGLVSYVIMTSLGPGLDPPLTASRTISMALFALAIHAFAGRLEEALVEAEDARMALAEQLGEVRRLNERLTELDQAKDDFVSTVSHELRTPLTVIQGLTGTLDTRWEDLDAQQRREIARRIGANTRGLQGIVDTLLDLARIERGGLEPDPEPVGLRGAIQESLLRLGPLLQDHPVEVDVAPGLVAHTDPRLLERVLDNLLVNAARHTSSGTAVDVRARPRGASIRVEVADAGSGLSPDEVARLGERFYRAGDRTETSAEEGIGLGLALVRDVLDALDSHLEVASVPDQGTVFAFDLPTVPSSHSASSPASPATGGVTSGEPRAPVP